MELEQRYVIEFFTGEGTPGAEIISGLRNYYRERALYRAQVYFWINEVNRGRADLNKIASPGREPGEGLATVIAGKLDADLHLSARRLAQSLAIAPSTVCRHLTGASGMKGRHLRWVPRTSTAAQKMVRVESAQHVLQALAKHKHSCFHFLFRGDES